MKTLKRVLSMTLVCLLLCGLLPSFALADDSVAGAMVLTDVTGKPGDTVTVDLKLTSNPGIVVLQIKSLTFDSTVLELTDVAVTIESGWNPTVVKETGRILLDKDPTANSTYTGSVATYTFKILDTAAAGETEIKLDYSACDKDEKYVTFNVTPAKVTVGEGGEIDANLKFATRSITLQDNLQVNYKVKKSVIDQGNYSDPYVVFKMNGAEVTADGALDAANTYYVFSFRNIAPNKINDTFSATVYATVDGKLVEGATLDYSICTYCYNQLNKATEKNELTTLLVDLLNYGTQAQIYTSYNTGNLANAALTGTQASWGTADDPTYATVENTKYETVENPLVSWKALGLYLEDTVSIRLKLAVDDKSGIIMKVKDDNGREWSYDDSSLKATESEYYFYFAGLKADQMRETVYITAYKDGVPVSNTVRYSIESYCYKQMTSGSEGLKLLLNAMMKYGDSAYNYAH